MGQPRRFEDSRALIGQIRNCSINATGKKIGIISNKATHGSGVNHSFHIYDTDTDAFIDYDLGEEYIPIAINWDKKEMRYFGVLTETSKN